MSNYQAFKENLLSGKTTCVDTVKKFIQRIENQKQLNIFLEVFEDSAIKTAQCLDEKISNGKPLGKLAGMVIGIKDNICYQNHKVSASSKILENFTSLYSATAVQRLLDEDAIIIGRLNCDEFAMGSSNENSAFGPAKNPLDPTKVPGGSSGGSAAAIAANLCHATLGSDTGGSIRQPASFCGVVGLKPTYGRISRYGLIAYGSSLDQIGPLAHNVDDVALLLKVMAGPDQMDTTAYNQQLEGFPTPLPQQSAPKKIVFLTNPIQHPNTDSEIVQKTKQLANILQEEGHQVTYKPFDLLDYLVPAYNVIANAEASSNLSRYDGVHYGFRSPDAVDMETTYAKSRTQGFGWEVKRRIMVGNFVLSSGYYDAYFAKAQKVRRQIQQYTNQLFEDADLVIYPTTPNTAFELGAKTDPIEMYLQDIFTVHANLSGNPCISLPLFRHSNGLPFGMQVMSKHYHENELLHFSNYLIHTV